MSVQSSGLDREEHHETRELVMSAFALARSLGINTLVVPAGEIGDALGQGVARR